MMNGRNVSFCPVFASNSARALARRRAMRVRSISKNDVTCAAVRRAATMWSLVRRTDLRHRLDEVARPRFRGRTVLLDACRRIRRGTCRRRRVGRIR